MSSSVLLSVHVVLHVLPQTIQTLTCNCYPSLVCSNVKGLAMIWTCRLLLAMSSSQMSKDCPYRVRQISRWARENTYWKLIRGKPWALTLGRLSASLSRILKQAIYIWAHCVCVCVCVRVCVQGSRLGPFASVRTPHSTWSPLLKG